jgi:hypothetical protein
MPENYVEQDVEHDELRQLVSDMHSAGHDCVPGVAADAVPPC